MITMGTSHVCGAILVPGKVSFVQSRASSLKVQGWKNRFSWRLEPEVIFLHHRSIKRTQSSSFHALVSASTNDLQNVDLPPVLPKRKKRPSVLPKRSKRRLPVLQQDPSLQPPANGLLVEYLIPVAHDMMEAKAIVTKGVQLLLNQFSVKACRFCSEVYIGSRGHTLRTCQGPQSASRFSLHDWVKGDINDVLVPIEAYHLADRLAAPIPHDRRFDVDRISAIDELCIQAGVDVPEYPTKRYTEPVRPSTRKKMQDASWVGAGVFTYYTDQGSYQLRKTSKQDQHKGSSREEAEDIVDNQVVSSRGYPIANNEAIDNQIKETKRLQEGSASSVSKSETIPLVDISTEDNVEVIAQKTLQAWERMGEGAQKLMSKYRVLACGYCPEIHIGPRGHKARVCGAFKHQWRDGKHGWQDASVEELIPPQYVWHVRDRFGPPLENALKNFYGKAPALIELCVQAGASVPESYKPLMRLDIAIPALDEYENVI